MGTVEMDEDEPIWGEKRGGGEIQCTIFKKKENIRAFFVPLKEIEETWLHDKMLRNRTSHFSQTMILSLTGICT